MKMNSTVHISAAFSTAFVTPFYVLLTSLFLNKEKSTKLSFHVIAEIEKSEQDKITAFVSNNGCEITFYDITDSFLLNSDLPIGYNVDSIITYYRLLFPLIVPKHIKRLIHLDTDIVVLKDLSSLYQTDLKKFPVGVVEEPFAAARPELGVYHHGSYFNAGVLLVDIDQWRQQCISEKTLAYLKAYPQNILWEDQDALNAVLVGNYYTLDKQYNFTSEFLPKKFRKNQIKRYISDIAILHYTSFFAKKPWSALCTNRLRFIYHNYLKKSPHGFKPKYLDVELDKAFVLKFLKIRWREFLIDHPSIYNWRKKNVQTLDKPGYPSVQKESSSKLKKSMG